MPTIWSPPKTPQFFRSSVQQQPMASASMCVEAIPQVNIDDLVAGRGEWNNLQQIIRQTFKSLIDSATVQHAETGRLHDGFKHLSQTINSKADRKTMDELRGDVIQACTGVAQLQEDMRQQQPAGGRGRGGSDEGMERMLEEKASLSFVRQALDNKLDRFEWETHRNEVATIGLLEKRVVDLDNYVRSTEGRLEAMMTEIARREVAAAVAAKPSPAVTTAEQAQDSVLTLARRMELLQSELCRLARVLDNKADGQEVEAALKLKASKASVQKRLTAIAEEEESTKEAIKKLKSRVEDVEGSTDGMGRRAAEQETTLRRVAMDVEAIMTRGSNSRHRTGDDGHHHHHHQVAQPSSSSLAVNSRGVEGLAQHAAKKASKLEKDMAAAVDRLKALEQDLNGRPTQAMLDEVKRTVNGDVKALEEEMLKELDARDEEIKHREEETMGYLRELELKVEASEEEHKEREADRKGLVRYERDLEQRLERVESRCQLLTPERLASVVSDALRDVEASKLLDLARARERGTSSSSRMDLSSPSFKDVLRRLDSLDFDFAHAGMLFKVLQEVVCDALGALEGNMMQQMGTWAQDSERKGEDVTRRMELLQTRLENDAIRRLESMQEELRQGNTERVQALIRQEIKQYQSLQQQQQQQQQRQEATGAGEAVSSTSSASRHHHAVSSVAASARTLASQRNPGDTFGSIRDDGDDDGASASTGATPGDHASRHHHQQRGSMSSRLSSLSTAGATRGHNRTPTPRSVLAGISEAPAEIGSSHRGGGGGGSISGSTTGSRGFQEIVLRRLDHVEREVERMHDQQDHRRVTTARKRKSRGGGKTADEKGAEDDHVKEEEEEEERSASSDDDMLEQRLVSLERHQRVIDQALSTMYSETQNQVMGATSQLRGFRVDHDQEVAGLAARVQAVEERLARGVLSLGEEKRGLEDMVKGVQTGLEKLRQQVESHEGVVDGKGLITDGQHKTEAMRRLEEQVLACQEQIHTRMSAVKARMEQPSIEGFAKAVAVMSEDLKDVRRSIALARTGQQVADGRPDDGSQASKQSVAAALEARIRQLESESASLSQQLYRVTNDLYMTNREVERLVAVSPVPLPPLPPRPSGTTTTTTAPSSSSSSSSALYQAPSSVAAGTSSGRRRRSEAQKMEEDEEKEEQHGPYSAGGREDDKDDHVSHGTLRRVPPQPVLDTPVGHKSCSVSRDMSRSRGSQQPSLQRDDASAFEQHRHQHLQGSVSRSVYSNGGRSQQQQAWAPSDMGSQSSMAQGSRSRRRPDEDAGGGWAEKEDEDEEEEEKGSKRSQAVMSSASLQATGAGDMSSRQQQQQQAQGFHEARSLSVVSEVTMASLGTGRPAPRGWSRGASYMSTREAAGDGGGHDMIGNHLIREEEGDQEDEEVRTASSTARQQQQQYRRGLSTQSHHHHHVLPSSSSSVGRTVPRGSGGGGGNYSLAGLDSISAKGRRLDNEEEEGTSVITGRQSSMVMTPPAAGTSTSSQEEQQLDAIRREKERLASLIPQLHNT